MDRFGRVFGFLVSFPGVFCWYFPNEKTAVWSTNGVSMLDSILLFSSGHCVADIWLFSDNRNIWFVASLAFHYVSLNLFFFFFFNDYQTRKSCSKLLFRESVRFRSYFLSILPLVSMAINWDSRSSGDGHFSLFFLFFFSAFNILPNSSTSDRNCFVCCANKFSGKRQTVRRFLPTATPKTSTNSIENKTKKEQLEYQLSSTKKNKKWNPLKVDL